MPKSIARQELISHIYNGFNFEQRASDGYYDATQMCAIFQKRFNNYYRTKGTKKFLASLSRSTLKSVDLLVEIKLDGKNEERGVFVHPLVANHLAFTLDSDFAVFVSFLIEAGKQGRLEYKPKAIKAIQCQSLVTESKVVRKTLTDILKEQNKKSVQIMGLTNQINWAVLGVNPKIYREQNGIPEKAILREYMTNEQRELCKYLEEIIIDWAFDDLEIEDYLSTGKLGKKIKVLMDRRRARNATALLT